MTDIDAPRLQLLQEAVDAVAASHAAAHGCVLGALHARLRGSGVDVGESDLRLLASIIDRTGRTVCVESVLRHSLTHAA